MQITGFTPVWPQNLDEIKMTKEEADLIIEFMRVFSWDIRENLVESTSLLYKRKICQWTVDDVKRTLPRTVFITNNHFIIILNTHSDKKQKFAWDLRKGTSFIRKAIHTPFENILLTWLTYSSRPSGLPEIAGVYQKRCTYALEKFYFTLASAIQLDKYTIDAKAIIELQEGIVRLHQFTYSPPKLIDDRGSFAYEVTGKVFHGDIAPDTVMALPVKDRLALRISKFTTAANFSTITWSLGYGSPETVLGNQDCSTEEFNLKFGQKRDAWALGLIIGSILRGGFHPDFPEMEIPNFSFIANKIRITNGIIDDSDIATITQEKIDAEIDPIIQGLSDQEPFLLGQWKVLKTWLVVNPDDRKSVIECHMTFPGAK